MVLNGQRRIVQPDLFIAELEHLMENNVVAHSQVNLSGDTALVQYLRNIDSDLKS